MMDRMDRTSWQLILAVITAAGVLWNAMQLQELTGKVDAMIEELAEEIDGCDRRTGRLLSSFGELADDGSPTAGVTRRASSM